MKLGEFFIQLGVQGDTKKLEKAVKDLEQAEKETSRLIEKNRELAKADTAEEKALIKKKYALRDEIDKKHKIISGNKEWTRSLRGVITGITGIVGAVSLAVAGMDRMANALYKTNQQAITFNRTTGISLSTLNRYASASMGVNYNATYQGMATSLSNVASNLWDIRMGRGDVSPYQELAFVGGRAINPMGKNVEQIVEEVREAIKGVDDLQATNIIQRMGFNPEDLMMLRMTREEMNKFQGSFLSSQEQEQLNKLGLQYKQIQLQMQVTGQRILIMLLPAFNKFMKVMEYLVKETKLFIEGFTKIPELIKGTQIALEGLGIFMTVFLSKLMLANPLLSAIILSLTGLFLLLDDYIAYKQGRPSVIGDIMEWKEGADKEADSNLDSYRDLNIGERYKFNFQHPIKATQMMMRYYTGGYEPKNDNLSFNNAPPIDNKILQNAIVNQNNSVTINTTQSADKAVANNINTMFGMAVSQMPIRV